MIGNKRSVPKGFHVHHRDTDTTNNRFENLIAMSEVDHKKLHGRSLLAVEDDVPF
jgi:hypothetical protein